MAGSRIHIGPRLKWQVKRERAFVIVGVALSTHGDLAQFVATLVARVVALLVKGIIRGLCLRMIRCTASVFHFVIT